jgi:hypothetical protein
MNPADEVSQAERRRVMAEERRMKTYCGQAQASLDDDRGGRYAMGSGSKPSVTGSSPIAYPKQPANSPWSRDACPQEPPLGYSVETMDPVGEQHEVEASRSGVKGGESNTGAGTASDGRLAPKFVRRF